ncbi:MAG: ribonuclease P protein component [Candidatus Giovannonibacteria bacterium]|nr:ribonuclease P protein component [Candidatus Giovannonibacteria bacterium]
MLKKALRLGRADLAKIFRSKTRSFRGKIVSVKVFRNGKFINRFAFIVSGPKNRGAALRNLARRRMAEAAKSFLKTIPAGRDVVFFIKLSERKSPSFTEIREDIKYVLAQNIF